MAFVCNYENFLPGCIFWKPCDHDQYTVTVASLNVENYMLMTTGFLFNEIFVSCQCQTR